MNPNAIVLTPEQFEQLQENIKSDLLAQLESQHKPKRMYCTEWIKVRTDLEEVLRGDYNDGCGQWYMNQQGIYAAFRLAFQKERVQYLNGVKEGRLTNFYTELMALINKYRDGQDLIGKE